MSTNSLSRNEAADVTQLFFHIVCSSMVANAAFVTNDKNFLSRASDLRQRYGITVASPNDAWTSFAPKYALVEPTESEIESLLDQQRTFLGTLRST